jgi:putative transposase
MSRPLRPEVLGAVWHITSRGNERQVVFQEDEDRERFLTLLGKVAGDFNWRVHAYVLMGNHYHLMVETPEPTLSRGMRHLNGVYSQAFNRRHDRVGHLFQGRFKAILVERESHLLELIRYVVMNPVRAGFVRSPRNWKWSSFRATAGLTSGPLWLESGWTLEQFEPSRPKAIDRYREFVGAEAGRAYRPWDSLDGQIYMGSKKFRLDVEESVRPLVRRGVPRPQLRPARPTAEEIVGAIESVIGPFSAKRGGRSRERRLFANLLQTEGLLTYAAMTEHLGVGPWEASHLAREGEALQRELTEFARQAAEVRERLQGGTTKYHRVGT